MKGKETIKTIVIAVLVSGIVCFILGAHYQQSTDHSLITEAQHLSK